MAKKRTAPKKAPTKSSKRSTKAAAKSGNSLKPIRAKSAGAKTNTASADDRGSTLRKIDWRLVTDKVNEMLSPTIIKTDDELSPTDEDFEAARLVMESNPQLFSPMRDSWPDKLKAEVSEARLTVMAKQRARSRYRFDQNYGLRPLRNQLEEALVSLVHAQDRRFEELVVAAPDADPLKLWEQAVRETPKESAAEIFVADSKRPLDLDMVRDAYESLDEHLAIYGEVLGELAWLGSSPRADDERGDREKLIDRLIVEMTESLPVVPENLRKVHEFAEEVRQQQNLPVAKVGDEARPTAWELVSECLRYLSHRWESLKATAARSQTDERYRNQTTASALWHSSDLPALPKPKDLQLRLRQEYTRLRIALKALEGSGDKSRTNPWSRCRPVADWLKLLEDLGDPMTAATFYRRRNGKAVPSIRQNPNKNRQSISLWLADLPPTYDDLAVVRHS